MRKMEEVPVFDGEEDACSGQNTRTQTFLLHIFKSEMEMHLEIITDIKSDTQSHHV